MLVSTGGSQAQPTVVNASDHRVDVGDVVTVPDRLPQACSRALDNPPDADFRNYAFVPGTTGFDNEMREFMRLRPHTTIFADPLVDNLVAFLRALQSNPAITNPIRHIIIASHANPEGNLQMSLDSTADRVIEFEDLDGLSGASSITIPAQGVLDPRPKDSSGRAVDAVFHVRGCRIGNAIPFMRLLKSKLGGRVKVTAPKHMDVMSRHVNPDGRVERMSYGFQVNNPTAFRNSREARAGFDAKGFTLIDNTRVPTARWGDWVPRTLPRIRSGRSQWAEVNVDTRMGNPVTGRVQSVPGRFRFRERRFFRPDFDIVPQGGVPGDEAGKKAAVRAELEKLDRFKASHSFPQWVRMGYPSMDAFMDGWTWNFRQDGTHLKGQAIRFEYMVIQPIANLSSNEVFVNFHPSSSGTAPIIQIREDDARFFTTL